LEAGRGTGRAAIEAWPRTGVPRLLQAAAGMTDGRLTRRQPRAPRRGRGPVEILCVFVNYP